MLPSVAGSWRPSRRRSQGGTRLSSCQPVGMACLLLPPTAARCISGTSLGSSRPKHNPAAGGGKSLCYALPAAVRPGVVLVSHRARAVEPPPLLRRPPCPMRPQHPPRWVVHRPLKLHLPSSLPFSPCQVVSPLIALMEDQVASFRAKGLRADFLSSTRSEADRRRLLADLQQRQPQTQVRRVFWGVGCGEEVGRLWKAAACWRKGRRHEREGECPPHPAVAARPHSVAMQLLFVTPELLATDAFLHCLRNAYAAGALLLAAIDEASGGGGMGQGGRERGGWMQGCRRGEGAAAAGVSTLPSPCGPPPHLCRRTA